MDAIVVGIDVSKDRLDVHAAVGGAFAVSRDAAGIDRAGAARALAPRIVALEATGGFETVVAAIPGGGAAGRRGQSGASPRLRPGARQRAKTDPLDAGLIAHFAEATVEPRPLPMRRASGSRIWSPGDARSSR